MNPNDFRFVYGLIVAIIVVCWSTRFIVRRYSALVVPVQRVAVDSDGHSRISYAVLPLYVVYFVTTIIIVGSTGAVTMALTENAAQARASAMYGIACALVICSAARFLSVVATTAWATSLVVLALSAIAYLSVQLFVDVSAISFISDVVFQTIDQSIFLFILIGSGIALGVTEVIILILQCITKEGIKASYHLVEERIAADERVEQVFVPVRVRTYTDDRIKDCIEQKGLQEIIWLTNTAPLQHMHAIREAMKGTDGEITQQITSKVRIIASRAAADRLRECTPFGRSVVLDQRIVREVDRPIRTRMLIVNHEFAIIHLPIPFAGGEEEESNYAAIITNPLRIHRFRSAFNEMWNELGRTTDD